jgi:hypothetical protein
VRDQIRSLIEQAQRSHDGVGDRRHLQSSILPDLAAEAVRMAHVAVALHRTQAAGLLLLRDQEAAA